MTGSAPPRCCPTWPLHVQCASRPLSVGSHSLWRPVSTVFQCSIHCKRTTDSSNQTTTGALGIGTRHHRSAPRLTTSLFVFVAAFLLLNPDDPKSWFDWCRVSLLLFIVFISYCWCKASAPIFFFLRWFLLPGQSRPGTPLSLRLIGH